MNAKGGARLLTSRFPLANEFLFAALVAPWLAKAEKGALDTNRSTA
jgi:hypothetical protein